MRSEEKIKEARWFCSVRLKPKKPSKNLRKMG